MAPGLAADMHFRDDVIAFVGPACMFALEPVARLAAYWNTPIITGMGDQVCAETGCPRKFVDWRFKCNFVYFSASFDGTVAIHVGHTESVAKVEQKRIIGG